jgi:GNAT superfamily N-acetyltransferase
MGDSVIRRAGPRDRELLLELIREFCQIDQHEFDEERVAGALPPLLEDDRFGVVWLIGEPSAGGPAAGVPAAGVPAAEDPVCGYAVVTWSYSLESGGADALLDEIYLRNRRTGLGGRAMQAILADLRRRGLSRMFLETERHNARVRRFYARQGFVEEDSIWMVWTAD